MTFRPKDPKAAAEKGRGKAVADEVRRRRRVYLADKHEQRRRL